MLSAARSPTKGAAPPPSAGHARSALWARHVAKIVKGLLVALGAVVVLEWSSNPVTATLALIGATLAVLVGDVYAEVIQREIEMRRRVGLGDARGILLHYAGVPLGALPALALFVLASSELISTGLAIELSVWGGIALLGGFGFAAGRLRGEPTMRSAVHGATLALVGVVVLVFKTWH
jgi:hypothetical protein